MAEKSFRQIESEIKEKGFSGVLMDSLEDLQNLSRLMGYVLEEAERGSDVALIERARNVMANVMVTVTSAIGLLKVLDDGR